MPNVVLLNNVDHHDLKVALGHGAAFGDAVNQVLVVPTEFAEVQRHYPILIRKDENGRYFAVALLGLDVDENLFLNEDGWNAAYVPAMQQRGPFRIGFGEREGETGAAREPMIHVDLDHPRVSRTAGEPLFREHGGNSAYLEHTIRVLRVIHDGLSAADVMFAAFAEHALIEPVTLQVSLDETTRYNIPDCFTIGAAKLAALDDAALGALNRRGFLGHAFMLATSLGNMSRLIELKNRKRRGAAPRATEI